MSVKYNIDPKKEVLDIALDQFELVSGKTLYSVNARVNIFGNSGGRTIVVCHAFSSSSELGDWWPEILNICNFKDDRVICVNMLGSCHGTTGPESINLETGKKYGSDFPEISVNDHASFLSRIMKEIDAEAIDFAVGFSMGGMALLAMLIENPAFANHYIIGAASDLSEMTKAINQLESQILLDNDWSESSLGQVRKLMRIHCASTDGLEKMVNKMVQNGRTLEEHLSGDSKSYIKYFSPYCHYFFTKAMNAMSLVGLDDYKNLNLEVGQSIDLIGIPNDLFTPIEFIQKIHEKLQRTSAQTSFTLVDSPYGHESWLVEANKFCSVIKRLIDDKKD